MTKNVIFMFFVATMIGGCGTLRSRSTTTPTAEVRPGMAVISTERLAELERHSEERDRLIDSQITPEERAEALARIEAHHTDEPPNYVEQMIQSARSLPPEAPAVARRTSGAPTLSGFGPPGMVTQTQAYGEGSAPWQRYGGATGGQELAIRIDSEYAIAIAIDGQVVQPISGGMTLSAPVYTGGGIASVPVIPPTRNGGWTGTQTVRTYRVLADSPGRHQLSWTCYSVVSGRVGRPAGQGVRTINVRTGTSFRIDGTMCGR